MLTADGLIEKMSEDLGVLPSHLGRIIKTAPLRYKVFYIRKRAGGLREVAQPAREVKAIQRWIVRFLTDLLPLHNAASAYRVGASIKRNASAHAQSRYMLKLDFEKFFPSIKASDVVIHLQQYCEESFDEDARKLIARACTWAPNRQPPLRLCIGAPSSPVLSNSIMYAFDCAVSALAKKDNVTYTRYADDITLSSTIAHVLDSYPDRVANLISELTYPRLRLNLGKTVRASRAGRRVVTGITLTPTDTLSVGRDRKRLIRSMFHRFQLGQLDGDAATKLRGLIAFTDSIEPGFAARLTSKLGKLPPSI